MAKHTARRAVRISAAVLALFVLAAGALALTRSRPEQPARKAQPVLEFDASDLTEVQSRPLARTLPMTGTLRPYAEAAVKAKVAGEIKELTVREGDAVRAGQVIGRIDPTEASAQLAEKKADLEAARAQLDVATRNLATQRALLERNFISQTAFDSTRGNYQVAVARLKAAEAAVAVAAKVLRDTALVAPIDGVVAARNAQRGERVAVDARVVTLVDVRRLELSAPLPAAEIAAVQVGQDIEFRVDGFDGRVFTGRVERINPAAAAGSRSIEVYGVIDNPDHLLRGGLFAEGRLIVGRSDQALVVPAGAVREERGERFVYVLDQGRLARRAVTLGLRDADQVQVLSGLRAGERVVRHNLGTLNEGAQAQIRSADAVQASR
ncbi:MAG: efflux RND transporter periplasmic adaptor subunit [Pseudomonadota bacterium]